MDSQRRYVSEETISQLLSLDRPYPNQPLPANPSMLSPELSDFLKQFASMSGAPYVHPEPIIFPTAVDKANWASALPPDNFKSRDTYSTWWCSKKDGKKVWIGLFSTWTSTYICDPNWDNQPWHAWGAAVLLPERGKRKYLIIWDCDPRPVTDSPGKKTKQPHEFLLPTQVKLLKFVQNH